MKTAVFCCVLLLCSCDRPRKKYAGVHWISDGVMICDATKQSVGWVKYYGPDWNAYAHVRKGTEHSTIDKYYESQDAASDVLYDFVASSGECPSVERNK